MNAREFLLLRTLNSALELALISDELSAEQVNGLAQKLGFESQETLRLVEGLKRQDLVELHWGGKVSITGKGKSALNPAESTPQVYLGKGATYVGPGAQVGAGAAVGQNAMPVTIKNGLPRYVKPRPGKKKLRTAVIAGFFFFMDTLPSEPNRQWSEPYDIRGHMSNAPRVHCALESHARLPRMFFSMAATLVQNSCSQLFCSSPNRCRASLFECESCAFSLA